MYPMQCAVCRKTPDELEEYVEAAKEDSDRYENSEEYVRNEEGTFNPRNNLFICTLCYIAIGMPSGPRGWKPEGLIDKP